MSSSSAEAPVRRPTGRAGASIVLLALFMLSGCGGSGDSTGFDTSRENEPSPAGNAGESKGPDRAAVAPSRCPSELPGCRTTEGRIIFVERVDPDGDGDAHFVVLDPQGITLPGFTAIDVRKGLRPDPLPGIGDLISAAGPVQTGSYGQSQIHAVQLRVAGRSGRVR